MPTPNTKTCPKCSADLTIAPNEYSTTCPTCGTRSRAGQMIDLMNATGGRPVVVEPDGHVHLANTN